MRKGIKSIVLTPNVILQTVYMAHSDDLFILSGQDVFISV